MCISSCLCFSCNAGAAELSLKIFFSTSSLLSGRCESPYKVMRINTALIFSTLLPPHTFLRLSVILCLSSSCAFACKAGAAVVSSRICLFFRSASSGRCWRCFSKLLRRSSLSIGLLST